MFDIRRSSAEEQPAVAALLDTYMLETYARRWGGTLAALAADLQGSRFDLLVAERDESLVAFAAWSPAYDLHHCIGGAQLRYLAGMAVGPPATRQLYERVAMVFEGADCIVGGRAFRTLAELAGRPVREMLRGLPLREWNDEP